MPQQDFCCNYIGQELWLNALDWERASEWQATMPEVWEVDGERAGTVQAAEPLTYVKLDGAGHMVCAQSGQCKAHGVACGHHGC